MNTLGLDNHPSILVIETDELLAQHISLDLQEAGYYPIVALVATIG